MAFGVHAVFAGTVQCLSPSLNAGREYLPYTSTKPLRRLVSRVFRRSFMQCIPSLYVSIVEWIDTVFLCFLEDTSLYLPLPVDEFSYKYGILTLSVKNTTIESINFIALRRSRSRFTNRLKSCWIYTGEIFTIFSLI